MPAKKYAPKKRKTTRKKRRKKKLVKVRYTPTITLLTILIVCILLALLYLDYDYQTRRQTSSHAPVSKVSKDNTTGTQEDIIIDIQDDTFHVDDLHIPRFHTPKTEQIIRHTGFTVSYCENHRIPHWVGYELTVDKTQGANSRSDRFVKDPHVKGSSAHTSDYTKSGYDRGHMAPAADMKWCINAMKESFYLSNICPQHPDLNRRGWKVLEDRVRTWAISDSAIIIVCGPLVHNECLRIGKNEVTVPEGFFKVILSPFAAPPQAIGFLFNNEKATNPLREHAVSVDSVEAVTGLDFFHQLPDHIEAIIEARVDTCYWGIQE